MVWSLRPLAPQIDFFPFFFVCVVGGRKKTTKKWKTNLFWHSSVVRKHFIHDISMFFKQVVNLRLGEFLPKFITPTSVLDDEILFFFFFIFIFFIFSKRVLLFCVRGVWTGYLRVKKKRGAKKSLIIFCIFWEVRWKGGDCKIVFFCFFLYFDQDNNPLTQLPNFGEFLLCETHNTFHKLWRD